MEINQQQEKKRALHYRAEIWKDDRFTNRNINWYDDKDADKGWKKLIAHFKETDERIMLKMVSDNTEIALWKNY